VKEENGSMEGRIVGGKIGRGLVGIVFVGNRGGDGSHGLGVWTPVDWSRFVVGAVILEGFKSSKLD